MDELILRKHEYTIRAKQILKRTAEDIVELSQICHEYHQEFGYQEYVRWIKDELKISGTFGKNLLNVYENFRDRTIIVLDYDPTALYLLAAPSIPESARQEAQERSDSGEHISAKLAKEIADRHKIEAEAAKLKDQIASLEADRTRLRKENDQVIRTKSADDACIIRQQEKFEELNRQIEELEAKVVQPQVIEKEVKVEVEKRIEIIPADYDVLKVEVNTLKEKLKTSKQKSGEELSQYQRRVDDLTKRLAQKEEALASFDMEQKQSKALRKLSEGENCILEAMRLLKGSYLSQPELQETIARHIESTRKILDRFVDQVGTIDLEVIYEQN